jgi:hypothetical protein
MVTTNKPARANDMYFTALLPPGPMAEYHPAYGGTARL